MNPIVLYSQSLERLRSFQAGVEYAAAGQTREKGWQEGMEKAAGILMALGKDNEFIAGQTGLTIDALQAIRMPSHTLEYGVGEQCDGCRTDDSKLLYPLFRPVASAVR